MTNTLNILLRHNYTSFNNISYDPDAKYVFPEFGADVATVLMNLAYYGYGLNAESYYALCNSSDSEIITWWQQTEKELKNITGEDRNIADFVVYKNFPAEVLSKSEAEYWIPQILMYCGFPKEFFTEKVKPREEMNERPRPKILRLAKSDVTLNNILNSYLSSPARWKEEELQDVVFLAQDRAINFASFGFKENLINLVKSFMANDHTISVNTATDVLRLAVGLSDGDVSLRENTKFRSFKKAERRFLLSMLNNCNNLEEDMARRSEVWKRLIHQLHPGDYKHKYAHVCKAMDNLYNDRLVTFNSTVEKLLADKDNSVLKLLSDRPGEFRRRLMHTLQLFGHETVEAFTQEKVLKKLTVAQLVSLKTFLESLNQRKYRTFPPKGNWNKLQISNLVYTATDNAKEICGAIDKQLAQRVPVVKLLDEKTKFIKLPNNGGEVSLYSRGTVFPIPDDVNFIRTASYWQNKTHCWFDNGWNFFNKDWKSLGSCCWNAIKFQNDAAVFSGDPMNSKEMNGRAAQLIDLYIDKLQKCNVRYAVWNILCYSRIPFSDVTEVFAALQWGKDPQKGKLFEPSRCQLMFPVKSKQLTKFVCLLDLEKRQMIYLDANLKGRVNSAAANSTILETQMPAFMEYIDSLPSVYDLFSNSVDTDKGDAYVLYSDKEVDLSDVKAYVFKPENKNNSYKEFNINTLLT